VQKEILPYGDLRKGPHAFARARPKDRAQWRKLKYAQRLTRTEAGALERNVVVEIVAAPGTASGLLRLGRSAGARTGTPTRAGTPTGRRAGARRAGRPTAPAPSICSSLPTISVE